MNRRESLKALGLMAAGTGLLTNACTQNTKENTLNNSKKDKLPGVQDWEHERTKTLQSDCFFTDHEMATITVLVDIIIPSDDKSGSASEAGVPEFIEFIVKDIPEYKTPMRGGLKWLDIQSQKRFGTSFTKCKSKDQLGIVDEIAYPDLARPELRQGVAFFALMRNLTASGFYTSEIGVKDIGYMGNKPGIWEGVPEEILKEHGFDPNSFMG